MLFLTKSAAVYGIDALIVDIEVNLQPARGEADTTPAVTIVGLPDAAVRESRERIRAAITAIMAVLGAALGVSVALAAFQYDGSQPVNVVRLIALLVVVPGLFLIVSLLLLPGRIPVLRGLQDLIAPLNPGALALAVFRRLSRASPEIANAFDWRAGRASAVGWGGGRAGADAEERGAR